MYRNRSVAMADARVFLIVNLDKRLRCDRSPVANLSQLIEGTPHQVAMSLVVPPLLTPNGPPPSVSHPLHKLPNELIDIILGPLCTNKDNPHLDLECVKCVTSLALTCQHFWYKLGATVRGLLLANIAPWANNRLSMTLKGHDPPPNALTLEDDEWLIRRYGICKRQKKNLRDCSCGNDQVDTEQHKHLLPPQEPASMWQRLCQSRFGILKFVHKDIKFLGQFRTTMADD